MRILKLGTLDVPTDRVRADIDELNRVDSGAVHKEGLLDDMLKLTPRMSYLTILGELLVQDVFVGALIIKNNHPLVGPSSAVLAPQEGIKPSDDL